MLLILLIKVKGQKNIQNIETWSQWMIKANRMILSRASDIEQDRASGRSRAKSKKQDTIIFKTYETYLAAVLHAVSED